MRLMIMMIPALAMAACTTTTTTEPESEISVNRAASTDCIDHTEWAYSANRGSGLYKEHCAYCHKSHGTGQGGVVPRLAGNAELMADPARGIRLMMVTRSGQGRSHGMTYDNMVAIFDGLSNKDIANVMTYVLSSWGNCAGPVLESDVKAVAQSMGKR